MRRAALAGFLVLAIAGMTAGAAAAFDGTYKGTVAGGLGERASLVYRNGEVASFRGRHIYLRCDGRRDHYGRPPGLRDLRTNSSGRFTGRARGKRKTYSFAARVRGRVRAERAHASGTADWHLRYRNGDVCNSRPRHMRWRANQPDLLFASRFEPPVAIGLPKSQLGYWRSALTGGDLGFPWDEGLTGSGHPNFLTLLPDDQNPASYYTSQLEPGFGIGGSTALLQGVIQDASFDAGRVRNQFPVPWPGARGYVSYMLKLQPGAGDAFGDRKDWRRIMEWGNGGEKRLFRIVIEIRGGRQGIGGPRWNIAGLQLSKRDDGGTNTHSLWDFYPEHPAPTFGKWMHVEVQWYEHPKKGKFKVWINGRRIVNYRGTTRGPAHLMPQIFKIYASSSVLEHGPLYQWIDDVTLGKRRIKGGF